LAAEDKGPNEKMDALIKEHAGNNDDSSQAYKDLAKMWSDYFLDLLPNESQPEALKRLTVLPEYDNMDGRYGWSTYLHGGDKVLMRDTVFFFANKLGVTNSSLSLEEKAKRIAEWAYSGERANSVMGRVGEYDGYTSDCVTQSDGLTAIYRLAGIPAINIHMARNNKWHVESFFSSMAFGITQLFTATTS
jgi:transglutaminase-like putative cysteine protease